jgi:hypothetical protein
VWWDVLAFVGGLAAAWYAGWQTTDLVWSMWLASFVVGYSILVWNLTSSLRELGGAVIRERTPVSQWAASAAILSVPMLVGLAFFTVHFGGFHLVHSVFLANFFPLEPNAAEQTSGFPGWETYGEVFLRYWIFLPLAFLAERTAFTFGTPPPADTAVTAQAIHARQKSSGSADMMAPYKNVIRMHLLIFFFAAVHFAKIENFAVYAVVYAVYFFPWRVFRREPDVVAYPAT